MCVRAALVLEELGTRRHRTGRSGCRSANNAVFQTVNSVQPTTGVHTVHTHVHVDFLSGGKGILHGAIDFTMALTNQSTDKCFQVLSACVEEPFADKETSRDIRVFVALHDFCPLVIISKAIA